MQLAGAAAGALPDKALAWLGEFHMKHGLAMRRYIGQFVDSCAGA
jgi:hypothetical protein